MYVPNYLHFVRMAWIWFSAVYKKHLDIWTWPKIDLFGIKNYPFPIFIWRTLWVIFETSFSFLNTLFSKNSWEIIIIRHLSDAGRNSHTRKSKSVDDCLGAWGCFHLREKAEDLPVGSWEFYTSFHLHHLHGHHSKEEGSKRSCF